MAALLRVLQRLVDVGNTVVVIEHHLDVMKNADYIIDLGPGAGEEGGYVVATGTPEQVAKVADSATGRYLKPILAIRRSPALKAKPAHGEPVESIAAGLKAIRTPYFMNHNSIPDLYLHHASAGSR